MLKKMTPNSQRRLTGWFLSALAALLLTSEPVDRLCTLPDSIHLTRGSSASLSLPGLFELDIDGSAAALSSMDERLNDAPVQLAAEQIGYSSLTVRFMGLIPVKTIPVSVEEERILIPGGLPVGVAIRTQGVLVVGASDLGGSTVSPAREAGLLPGDLIREVDGEIVTSSRHLSSLIESDEMVILTVARDDQILSVPITPAEDPRDGEYRLGVWVRDSTAGVGTLSFYDPATGRYGALGHAITDVDTGLILDVQNGEIVESSISEIHKGEAGSPGELVGRFSSGSRALGSIDANGESGIFGTVYEPLANPLYPDGLPIASADSVRMGAAQLLTTLDNTGMHAYDCEIVRISRTSGRRSMVLQITDPVLLEKTGGIVQGMSGSPIIQDGKLVGAVTHVLVNDPTRGYGIFIENMLDAVG